MNKKKLIRAVAKRTGKSIAVVTDIVDEIFRPADERTADGKLVRKAGVIASELSRGRRVMLTGFGVFGVKGSGWRDGRNPSTGEAIRIPPSQLPRFGSGATLKAHVKAGTPEYGEDPDDGGPDEDDDNEGETGEE